MSRIQRSIDALKVEFYAAGSEYQKTQDKALLSDLHALTAALNMLEEFAHGRRITVITDCL